MSLLDAATEVQYRKDMQRRGRLGYEEQAKNDAIAHSAIQGLTNRNKQAIPEAIDEIAKQAGERAEKETRDRLEKMNGAYIESDLHKAYREQLKHIRIDDDPRKYQFTVTSEEPPEDPEK